MISNNVKVEDGSYLVVDIPTEIVLSSGHVGCNRGCVLQGSNKVKVELVGNYGVGELGEVKIFNVRNPVSTMPTGSFGVEIFN